MDKGDLMFREFELAGWDNSAIVANYHKHISHVTTQSIEALLDAAGVGTGSRVLDVATGAGYVANAAGRRGAEVVGVDFSAAQVRLARTTYADVQFEQADAETLPFQPRSFDAVVNGFGMCHISNPDAALREAFRVQKPRGRVAYTVYAAPDRDIALGAVYAAIRADGSMEIGLAEGPNFFLLSDPLWSVDALTRAGFQSVRCQLVEQMWRVSRPEDLLTSIADGSVRGGATLRRQSKGAWAAIQRALQDSLAPYKRRECYEIPAPALLASSLEAQHRNGLVPILVPASATIL